MTLEGSHGLAQEVASSKSASRGGLAQTVTEWISQESTEVLAQEVFECQPQKVAGF